MHERTVRTVWITWGVAVIAVAAGSLLYMKMSHQRSKAQASATGLETPIIPLLNPDEEGAFLPITVSPRRIAVRSKERMGLVDVTVTNHQEVSWYDCDLVLEPTSSAIYYTVEPLGGPGSEVQSIPVGVLDENSGLEFRRWSIVRLAPKGSVAYRLKYRLRTADPKAELRFSVSPGSSEMRPPRVVTHP